MCGHPSGLRTPEEMVKICQARMKFLEEDPRAEYLRKQDEEGKLPLRWWEKKNGTP